MTRLRVTAPAGRVRVDAEGGPLAVRVMSAGETSVRVALVATQALLLAGDHVRLEVVVDPGLTCRIDDIAGTVAYDADGAAASWSVAVTVGAGGRLVWWGEPFVVARGANVIRHSSLALADGATALLRETLVLGRTGERGGTLHNRTEVRTGGVPLLVEDLDLRPERRSRPGLLGDARVLDTALLLGRRAPDDPVLPPGHRFDLAGPGTLARARRAGLAGSPVDGWFRTWAAGLTPGG